MKHTLFIIVASVAFAASVQHTAAQEYCGGINNAGSCPVGTSCQNINPENGEGRCLPDPSATIPPLPSATNVVPVPSPQSGPNGAFVPLAPIDGLTKEGVVDSNTLSEFLRNLYRFLVGIAATLAVIEIVIGGLQYATQDIPSQKSDGKQRIWNAIFGLILVLSPVLVFSLINPAILNLSIQMRPLDTKHTDRFSSTPVAPLPETTNSPLGSTSYHFCTGRDCSEGEAACRATTPGSISPAVPAVQCLRSDGSIGNRLDSSLNPFSAYVCPSGQSLIVTCTYNAPMQIP